MIDLVCICSYIYLTTYFLIIRNNIIHFCTMAFLLDILGVVIFVSEVWQVKGAFDQQNSVCDTFITNHMYHNHYINEDSTPYDIQNTLN